MDRIRPASGLASDPSAPTPLLRTVLLCDLVESTALVERLGDSRVAQLFQHHDALLTQLLAASHGQLIDKADGVLALFERPVQALEFALAYQQGLRALGQDGGETLQARVGIHVGDVMTWAHSTAEVLAGAKALEVEGLAKPVAARLMGLALPGQILLSGMAQNLAQRAQDELGAGAHDLQWRLHGRYRFKGVAAPMLVHEVGRTGLSPLRAPPSGSKAWRELPLWRRPPVLAMQLVLLLGLLVAAVASTLRSPPAIAFSERDWLLVADFNNRTAEPLYEDALDSALRVGLEQSRYVNLLSDQQIDQALRRMQREQPRLDRATAIELALREGIPALVLPTVADVAGRTRISLELVDPSSGVTVYTGMAEAGRGHVIRALDEVLVDLRSELGESLASIDKSSAPLEKVTTPSLDALRAFALGQQAFALGDNLAAEAKFGQALQLDPEFAMATVGLARIHYGRRNYETFREFARQAHAHAARLSNRERLYLDALRAMAEGQPGYAEKWQQLLDVYPDHHAAALNCATGRLSDHRFEAALQCLQTALAPIALTRPVALQLKGIAELGLGQAAEARRSIEAALAAGVAGSGVFESGALAATGAFADAYAVLDQAAQAGRIEAHLQAIQRAALQLAQGDWQLAAASPCDSPSATGELPPAWQCAGWLTRTALADDRKQVRQYGARVIASGWQHLAGASPARQEAIISAMLYAAIRQQDAQGDGDWQAMLERLQPAIASAPHAGPQQLAVVLRARALLPANPAAAVALLEPLLDERSLMLTHAALANAYAEAGRHADALARLDWLAQHASRAYAERSDTLLLRIDNVLQIRTLDLLAAEVLLRRGDRAAAQARYQRFMQAWPDAARVPMLATRVATLDAALSPLTP